MTAAALIQRLASSFLKEDSLPVDEALALQALIDGDALTPVFQPILDYRSHTYIGYEGLIRGPQDSPWHMPLALFEAARRHQLTMALERACREAIFRRFAELQLPGKLFINASPGCLQDPAFRNGRTTGLLRDLGLSPSRIIIEITENEQIEDFGEIHDALQ